MNTHRIALRNWFEFAALKYKHKIISEIYSLGFVVSVLLKNDEKNSRRDMIQSIFMYF